MRPRPIVLVGTMQCQEGDFERCCEAIERQRGVHVIHKVISNKPERDAHNELWTMFTEASQEGFEMMTKVDADTVLAHPDVLAHTFKLFEENSRVTSVQSPLYDYFTDGFINGLNSFSPKVKFGQAPTLYCDRVDTGHDIQLQASHVPLSLRPAGYHCMFANRKQAFHFGLHRALKKQWSLLRSVEDAQKKFGDQIRRYAVHGCDMSDRFRRDHGGYDYTDPEFTQAFNEAIKKVENEE